MRGSPSGVRDGPVHRGRETPHHGLAFEFRSPWNGIRLQEAGASRTSRTRVAGRSDAKASEVMTFRGRMPGGKRDRPHGIVNQVDRVAIPASPAHELANDLFILNRENRLAASHGASIDRRWRMRHFGVFGCGQLELEGRPASHFAVHPDMSAALLHDAVDHCQAKHCQAEPRCCLSMEGCDLRISSSCAPRGNQQATVAAAAYRVGRSPMSRGSSRSGTN